MGNLESYSNHRIVYAYGVQDTNYAEANTSILAARHKGGELFINYKFRLVNEDWKAYDIVVDNIRLVDNY